MSTIPQNWKVRITESNREVLEQWRIKQPNVDQDPKITCLVPPALNGWLLSGRGWDSSYMHLGGGYGYEEITFEEFKKYVLMEQQEIKFKPISMKCNQEQFDAIKPILEKRGMEIRSINSFASNPYLTNNFTDISGIISNLVIGDFLNVHGRTVYEEWNQDLFLRCCGIDPTPKFKVGDKVIIKKYSNGYVTGGWIGEFQNIIQTQGYLTIRWVYTRKDGTQIIDFEESAYQADSSWLLLYTETKTEMKTYNIKISDLKKIHDVACSSWKTKIKALIVDPFAESIELTQTQVDEMFKAATTQQRPVLVEVFGEPVSQCPYKKGQLLWVWDFESKFPSIRKFIEMDGSKFNVHRSNGTGTITWDCAAPFNNGQLPQQFKHLLENQ